MELMETKMFSAKTKRGERSFTSVVQE